MKNRTSLLSFLIAHLLLFSCIKRDKMDEMANNAPTQTGGTPWEKPIAATLKTGRFTSYEHNLSGNVTVLRDTTNNTLLQLENFTMIAGPDVHVYLSSYSAFSPSTAKEIAHLTTGYDNYALVIDITDNEDLSTYKYVLIWCVKYKSLFGYAELK